jgi:hypothetical protein
MGWRPAGSHTLVCLVGVLRPHQLHVARRPGQASPPKTPANLEDPDRGQAFWNELPSTSSANSRRRDDTQTEPSPVQNPSRGTLLLPSTASRWELLSRRAPRYHCDPTLARCSRTSTTESRLAAQRPFVATAPPPSPLGVGWAVCGFDHVEGYNKSSSTIADIKAGTCCRRHTDTYIRTCHQDTLEPACTQVLYFLPVLLLVLWGLVCF